MRLQKVREEVLFYTITVATFLLLTVLSLLFLHREHTRNRQMLEIETVRLAADLIEALRQRPFIDASDLRSDIVGFGLYGTDWKALNRFGTAPKDIGKWITESDLKKGRVNRVEFKGNRLVIVRSLGMVPMGRESMRGMMRGRMKEPMLPPMEPIPPLGRIVYLELDIRDWLTSQRLIQYGFYIVPLLLVLIFLGTTLLYRNNLSYRRNEQRNRELVQLGEAARTLAHEIKNPLGAIRIQTATLQKVLPEPYHRNLQVITEEVDRLRLLVDKVGDFLKNPMGDPEPVDVQGMIQDLLPRFPVPISFLPKSAGPLQVWIDRNRFRTVLENILRNAVESLSETSGSMQEEESGQDASPRVTVETAGRGDRVEIRILDRGIGLPKGAEDRIFEPFFTTKPTGSGIGLAISRRFVEAAGGTLTVVPRSEGGGTEARIVLPRYKEVGYADSGNR